ncbi:MAG: membrane dipeptidase [Chlamydiota bacterium]
MTTCIVDFHCDLLAYLAQNKDRAAALHPDSNCSLPQLRRGKVGVQTFAIFTETSPGSTRRAAAQFECWRQLLKTYHHEIKPFDRADDHRIRALLAIENASGLLEEDEPLALIFDRIENMQPLLYISLTWNGENRFGGGNGTTVGLKPDGLRVLEYLAKTGIAIDLSHASDQLAADIIEAIDQKKLDLTPIASHSNFRAVTPAPRNLPDSIARAIIERQGIIGMNLFRHFLGSTASSLIDHCCHGLSLGGSKALCFGADFFGGISLTMGEYPAPFFHKKMSSAAHYSYCFNLLRETLSPAGIRRIAHANGLSFIQEKFS